MFSPYSMRRFVAKMMPLAHLQRTPYLGTTHAISIPTTDGVALGATLFPCGSPDVIVVCHGFGATQRSIDIVWLAEALADTWNVLTFDWRGYGLSEGLASLGSTEAADLTAVLAYVRQLGYRRVGLIGESMGGLITLATLGAMADDEGFPMPDRVATLGAPAGYDLTGWPRPFLVDTVAPITWLRPFAPLLGFRLGDVSVPRPLDVAHCVAVPLLIVQGDRDRTVPVENAYLLAEQIPHAELRIYPGVYHGVVAMRAQCPSRFLADLHTHFAGMSSDEH